MTRRTTVAVDAALLARAKQVLGVKTNRAAAEMVLRAVVERQEQLDAIADIASIDLDPAPVKVHVEP